MTKRSGVSVSRRRFLAGMGAAATTLIGSEMLPGGSGLLMRRARAERARYELRMGASVISKTNERHLATGIYRFVELVEQLTDGELRIQLVDSGQGCAEPTCGDRVANGIFDLGSSSPQNLGSVFPYAIALDWPMLWSRREDYLNLLFSPASNALYRDVMLKRYGIVPLFGSGEMRSIMMGKKYEDADPIRTPAQLQGAKIRITNSVMIGAFAQSLNMNPIPLAWTELLEGLRTGVVDATETWPGAATGFGMHNVLSQDVPVDFCPGFELVFISARSYDKLPDRIKESMLEAAYQAMIHGYEAVAHAQNAIVGNGPEPSQSSAYVESGLRRVALTPDEMAAFRAAAGISQNEDIYKSIRAKLTSIAGRDVLDPLQEFQASVAGKPLNPQRWWT